MEWPSVKHEESDNEVREKTWMLFFFESVKGYSKSVNKFE